MKFPLAARITCAAYLAAPPLAYAHHAFNGTLDMSRIVHVDGMVTEMS